jgi:hypothetical protein
LETEDRRLDAQAVCVIEPANEVMQKAGLLGESPILGRLRVFY